MGGGFALGKLSRKLDRPLLQFFVVNFCHRSPCAQLQLICIAFQRNGKIPRYQSWGIRKSNQAKWTLNQGIIDSPLFHVKYSAQRVISSFRSPIEKESSQHAESTAVGLLFNSSRNNQIPFNLTPYPPSLSLFLSLSAFLSRSRAHRWGPADCRRGRHTRNSRHVHIRSLNFCPLPLSLSRSFFPHYVEANSFYRCVYFGVADDY